MGTHTNKQTNRWIEFYHLTKAKCKSAKCARSGCTTRMKKKQSTPEKKLANREKNTNNKSNSLLPSCTEYVRYKNRNPKPKPLFFVHRFVVGHTHMVDIWTLELSSLALSICFFDSFIRSFVWLARSLVCLFVCLFVLIANLSLTISVDLKWKSCHILFCYCAFAFVYLYVCISVSCIAFFCV